MVTFKKYLLEQSSVPSSASAGGGLAQLLGQTTLDKKSETKKDSGSYGIPFINPSDIKPTGATTTRNASYYGSIYLDFTSYLDLKPQYRPAEATQFWQSQGKNIPAAEADMRRRYPKWHPSLTLENTGKGAFVGNLAPGFDLGISTSYGYKPGQLLYITDSNNKPIGLNNGVFRVGDKGGGSLKERNALDFYVGNDTNLKNYFSSLKGGLKVTPVSIEGTSKNSLQLALAKMPNWGLKGQSATDMSRLASSPSTVATGDKIASNNTSSQAPESDITLNPVEAGARALKSVYDFWSQLGAAS